MQHKDTALVGRVIEEAGDRHSQVEIDQLKYELAKLFRGNVTSVGHGDEFVANCVPSAQYIMTSLSILFTDLKGSTALYQSIGDSAAFRQVMDHFNILRDNVARHHCALIKTIGDTIMVVLPIQPML